MIFKLKNGSMMTQEIHNSVLNELMFSMMAQNAVKNTSLGKGGKQPAQNLKIDDLKSVEIIF